MLDYVKALKDINVPLSLDGIWDFLNNMSFPVATVAIGLLVLLAVQGYKIFKSLTYVVAAVGLGFAGHLYLAPRVADFIIPKIPESVSIDVNVAIAFLCAMFGVLIAHFSHEFVVFCLGGACGYAIGYFIVAGKLAAYFTSIPFLTHKFAYIGVGVVCALMLAIFFLLTFKYLYIIGSSVGLMILSCYILFKQMMPEGDGKISVGFMAVGALIGIFMMIHQFSEENRDDNFNF